MQTPPNLDPILRSYFQIMELKSLLRQGWLRVGVEPGQVESVADHCFGTALLCLLLAREVDPAQAAQMALVHELGEVYAGDITPHDGIGKAEKHRREAESITKVLDGLPPALSAKLRGLWDEYEAQATPTAHFVKTMDSLEMACQATRYHLGGKPGMAEFLASAQERLAQGEYAPIINSLAQITGNSGILDQS